MRSLGRGSATRDEAIAAAYVASQFQSVRARPPPGMDGYLAEGDCDPRVLVRARLTLTVGGMAVGSPTLLLSSGRKPISGALTLAIRAPIRQSCPTCRCLLVIGQERRSDDHLSRDGRHSR